MRKELSLINKCKSWKECNQQIAKLTTGKHAKLGGSVFEHVVKLYLQTEPKYQTKFKQVWLLDEVPYKVKQLLRLPQADEGIDLVVKTNDDEYWSVQAKYRSNIEETLVFAGKGGLSTFQSLSFVTCKNISHGLICATVNKPPVKKHLLKNIGFEVADTWLSLDENNFAGWKRIQAKAKGKKLIVKPATPRPHQRSAIKEAKKHFLTSKNVRGKMIMPCGTGKSLASFWIAHELKAKNIIVAVPSIALIKQTLNTWANESILNKRKIDWLCVCSDESVDNDQDEIISNTSDLGIKPTTNQKEIEKFLKNKTKNLKVIFTTYQSGMVTAKAARKIKTSFDLGLFDEAHKTVGHKDKQMAHLIFEKNIKIKKRLFMTATERLFRIKKDKEEYASMDNVKEYGSIFYQLSFKKAINSNPQIISDYKIITIGVNESEIEDLINSNELIRIRKEIDNITARELAVGIALRKALKDKKIKNALSFHSSIKRAQNFEKQQKILSDIYPQFGNLDTFHISGKMSASQRTAHLKDFENSRKSLLTNARCLTEGVDVPSIDCVCFTDPKRSKVDIVQAAGRALRLSKGKKFGYIMIPIILSKNQNIEEASFKSGFEEVIFTIGALSQQDERIADTLRLIKGKKKPNRGNPISELTTLNKIQKIDKNRFENNIKLKIWDKIANANYRSYEEAMNFAINLNLINVSQWNKFAKSNSRPKDIPYSPNVIYKNKGWENWGKFLGTGSVYNKYKRKNYWDFKKAHKYVLSLKLKNQKEWWSFAKSKEKPFELPTNPNAQYANKGWISLGHWLGTGAIAAHKIKYRKFEDAKKFNQNIIKKNKITTFKDARELIQKIKLPIDIPKTPDVVYKNEKNWKGSTDYFFGNAFKFKAKNIRKFYDARSFVRKLNLKFRKDWSEYCKGKLKKLEKKPSDIPSSPNTVYKNTGWKNWGDWLGSDVKKGGQLGNHKGINYFTYSQAKKIVRKMNLTSTVQYKKAAKIQNKKSQKKLPIYPIIVYKNEGWDGWESYLGNFILSKDFSYLNYSSARKLITTYKFKKIKEYKEAKRKNKLPKNIPTNADRVYKNKGWISWGKFLGTNRIADQLKVFTNFNEAKKYIRKQKLNSRNEYKEWYDKKYKTKKNKFILPKYPGASYKNKGWKGWVDFLGKIK